jgi:hypothetical protein
MFDGRLDWQKVERVDVLHCLQDYGKTLDASNRKKTVSFDKFKSFFWITKQNVFFGKYLKCVLVKKNYFTKNTKNQNCYSFTM